MTGFAYRTTVKPWRSLRVEQLSSLDETIDQYFARYEATGNEELFESLCPYFGVPWPAGMALAVYAEEQARRWQGRSVL